MYDFEFERPSTVADAVEALRSEGAQAISGGQTLIPTLKNRLANPSKLVSLTGIEKLRGVCSDGGGNLCVGAATPHADVAGRIRRKVSGARRTGGQYRRPGGSEPRHGRRKPRQQRPVGLLPCSRAGNRRRHRNQSTEMLADEFSPACSRPPWATAK